MEGQMTSYGKERLTKGEQPNPKEQNQEPQKTASGKSEETVVKEFAAGAQLISELLWAGGCCVPLIPPFECECVRR